MKTIKKLLSLVDREAEEKRVDSRYFPAPSYPLNVSIMNLKKEQRSTIEDISNGGLLLSMTVDPVVVETEKYTLQIDFEDQNFQVTAECSRSFFKEKIYYCAFQVDLVGVSSSLFFQTVAPVAIGQSLKFSGKYSQGEQRYYGISETRIIFWPDGSSGKALELKTDKYIFKIDPGVDRLKVFIKREGDGFEQEDLSIVEITSESDPETHLGAVRFYKNTILNIGDNVSDEIKKLMQKAI
jgi:hypothetical protein